MSLRSRSLASLVPLVGRGGMLEAVLNTFCGCSTMGPVLSLELLVNRMQPQKIWLL
jgi:hypothetical protein